MENCFCSAGAGREMGRGGEGRGGELLLARWGEGGRGLMYVCTA